MVFLAEICKLPEMKEFLQSPLLFPQKKDDVFHKLLGGNVEKITLSLIDLIVKKRQGKASFPQLHGYLYTKQRNTRESRSLSLPLQLKLMKKSKSRITDLISKVFTNKVELKEHIDPEIVGGFILQIEDII